MIQQTLFNRVNIYVKNRKLIEAAIGYRAFSKKHIKLNKMNVKFNKIIAKEIIYFSLIILVSILIWCLIEFNNYHLQQKNFRINNEISDNNLNLNSLKAKILSKSSSKQLDENLLIMHQEGVSDSDFILFYNDFVNKFKNKEIVKKRNILISKNKILNNKLIENKLNFIDNSIDNGFTKWTSFFLLLIIYPLRFLLIAINWSIQTLKKT